MYILFKYAAMSFGMVSHRG